MNIHKKIIKIALITILITLLIGGDVLFMGQGIVKAIYEELETQQTATNNKNVTFNSYFRANDENVHSKMAKISEGETLMLNIAVNNSRNII